MAFNDGDPIDASKLQALETELAKTKAMMPKIGTSANNISIDNSTTVTGPQVFGERSAKISIPSGVKHGIKIPFTGTINSVPKSVVATPYVGSTQTVIPTIAVTSIAKDGFIIATSSTKKMDIYVYFIAIS